MNQPKIVHGTCQACHKIQSFQQARKAAPLISQFLWQKLKKIHRSKTRLQIKTLMKIGMQETKEQWDQKHILSAYKPAVNLAFGTAQEKNRQANFFKIKKIVC